MSLCQECKNRDNCTSLCPEAETYVNQDWIGLKEIPIGLPDHFPKGKFDIAERELSSYLNKLYKQSRLTQVDTLLRKGLSRREIAQLLGITGNAVRQAVRKLKKKDTKNPKRERVSI